MTETHHLFHYKKCTLHYIKVGKGNTPLFLFHGFGQDRNAFDNILNQPQSKYTCYVFDLFFHGKSKWGYAETPLTKDFWCELLISFLKQEGINRFSLAGYSLGARFVFASLVCCAEKVEEVFLLAPDGIKTSFWYNLATYPLLFRKLFKSMVSHPNRFQVLATGLNKLNLIDKGLLRFAKSQMDTAEKRERVYYSWVVLRKLRFNSKKTAELLLTYNIKTQLFLGAYDKVITQKSVAPLLRHAKNVKVIRLSTGHNKLIEEAIPRIVFA
jgi:pimeloyl-ACP methyl ester carboxylesterase